MKKVIERMFYWRWYSISSKITLLHNDLSFLPERMKIEKVEKLVANLYNKTDYVIHIINLRQTLNHELVLKKLRRVIKFKGLVKIIYG